MLTIGKRNMCSALLAFLPAQSSLAETATEADVIALIETCIAFVASDAEFAFGPDWSLNEYEERNHRTKPETRIDREVLNLRFRAEIRADDRVATQGRAVIDRQCLVNPVRESSSLRYQNEIDGYSAVEQVDRFLVEQAARTFADREVGAGNYVDLTELFREVQASDPPEVSVQRCTVPSILVRVNTKEDGGALGWDWTISVVRRDDAPEACSRS